MRIAQHSCASKYPYPQTWSVFGSVTLLFEVGNLKLAEDSYKYYNKTPYLQEFTGMYNSESAFQSASSVQIVSQTPPTVLGINDKAPIEQCSK